MILYYHTHTKTTYTFPKNLSDQFAWSSALVDAWATMVMFEADGPYMEKFITEYIESQTKDLPEDDPQREAMREAMQADIQMTYDAGEAAKREYERIDRMLIENKQRRIDEFENRKKSS